ncbi:hypothetical protein [Streptomyces vastus]
MIGSLLMVISHWAHDVLRPMKVSPGLLPILRSRMQDELLALVLLHPEREYGLTEPAALIEKAIPNMPRY